MIMSTLPPQDDADPDGIDAEAFAALQEVLNKAPPAAATANGGVVIQNATNVYTAPVYIRTQVNHLDD